MNVMDRVVSWCDRDLADMTPGELMDVITSLARENATLREAVDRETLAHLRTARYAGARG